MSSNVLTPAGPFAPPHPGPDAAQAPPQPSERDDT